MNLVFGMHIKKGAKNMNGVQEKKNNNYYNYYHLYQKYVLHLPVEHVFQGWPNVVNIIKTINPIKKKEK